MNLILLFGIFAFAFLGGSIFFHLEHTAAQQRKQETQRNAAECIDFIMSMGAMQIIKEKTSKMIVTECYPVETDIRSQWSWRVATLYGFGILTTLGYGRIEALTTAGRLFCVVFGIIGIPLMMLTFANIGKYINEFGPRLRKKLKEVKSHMRTSKGSLNKLTEESEHEEEINENDGTEINPIILIGMLIVYLVVGAALLPLLNGRFDFFNGIYYTFLCISVIEFGVLVPENINYVPIVLLYICVGLSITSITMEFGADYVKKFHFIGRRLSHVRCMRIWFGGNTLRVDELIEAVAKNWAVDPDVVRDTNLDEIVRIAIKVKKGKLPPDSYLRREWFGIWPPELLPILIKDGGVPRWIDDLESIAAYNRLFNCAPPLYASDVVLVQTVQVVHPSPKSSFFITPLISAKMKKQRKHCIIPFLPYIDQ